MKALTEKKLIELSEFISNNQFIEDCYKELITAKIREIIACECNEQKLGKLDLYDFTDNKDTYRNWVRAVHYMNGYRYASETHILIKIKSDYPIEMEGKSICKDGSELSDVRLPNFDSVIASWDSLQTSSDFKIDFDRLNECVKQAKAHKKIYKKATISILELGDTGTYVDAFLFFKFANAIKALGGDTCKVKVGQYAHSINYKSDDVDILIMPQMKPECIDDNVLIQKI